MSVTSRSAGPAQWMASGVHELEVIEAFQVEPEHAARAVKLERVADLQRSEPGRLERAAAAVGESRSPGRRRRPGGSTERPRRGDAFAHGAVEVEGGVEEVREQSSATPEPASAGSILHGPGARESAPTVGGTPRCSDRSCRGVPRQSLTRVGDGRNATVVRPIPSPARSSPRQPWLRLRRQSGRAASRTYHLARRGRGHCDRPVKVVRQEISTASMSFRSIAVRQSVTSLPSPSGRP